MKLKKVGVLTVIMLLAALFNTAAYAAYTEAFTITESGSTKADTLSENAIVIRNNRDSSDVNKRGANLREAYIKFDIGAYSGQYPVSQARLRMYLKQNPSNAGVSSETETPTCDVYAFGSLNTDWSGTAITYSKALSDGVRPEVDELSTEISTYAEDKECGYLDMLSFDTKSSTTEAYYFDITPFVNDLLASGQTVGTICLLQAGGSISRESTVMQFYCEDTATDTAMIPAVEITPSVKAVVKTVKDFSAGKKPSVMLAGYNNTEEEQPVTILGVITDEDGRLYTAAATSDALKVSAKAQAVRINFENALPEDITGYELYVYALESADLMRLINRTTQYGGEEFVPYSAEGNETQDYPDIAEYKISARDTEIGTLTLTGTLDTARAGVEIAARAYVNGEDITSQEQAFASVVTDADGAFSLTLVMPEASGSYEILLGGLNIKEEKKIESVSYFKPSDVLAALADVNAAEDAEQLETLLRGENSAQLKYAELLSIEYAPALDAINGGGSLSSFCNYILAKREEADGFETLSAFHNALAEAADMEKIASSSKVSDELRNIIEGYVCETEIYKKLYSDSEIALDSDVKDKALLSLLGREYGGIGELCNAFDETVVVTAITNVLYGKVEEVMSIGKDVLGFDIDEHSDYQKLSTSRKAKVLKKFANADIAKPDEVVEFLENAIAAVVKETSSSSGGGGGGGGNSGSSVVVNVTKEELKQNIPEPIDVTNIAGFTDLDGYEWAKESVNALVKAGVVAEGELFRPDDSVTRAEFVKMLVCAAGLPDSNADCTFEDTSKDMWHYSYIASAYKNGVASGISDTLFGVGQDITRQEMAALAYRVLKVKNKEVSLADCDFSDNNSISDWAITAVYALKNAGIINGVSQTEFAPLKNATRAEAAVIISRLMAYINGEGEEQAK